MRAYYRMDTQPRERIYGIVTAHDDNGMVTVEHPHTAVRRTVPEGQCIIEDASVYAYIQQRGRQAAALQPLRHHLAQLRLHTAASHQEYSDGITARIAVAAVANHVPHVAPHDLAALHRMVHHISASTPTTTWHWMQIQELEAWLWALANEDNRNSMAQNGAAADCGAGTWIE